MFGRFLLGIKKFYMQKYFNNYIIIDEAAFCLGVFTVTNRQWNIKFFF